MSISILTLPGSEVSQLPRSALPMGPSESGRVEELDSLRGLAALVVFSSHFVLILAVWPHWLKLLVDSPAELLLYAGHQAVILFFILSGFVLYLPYTRRGSNPKYLPFIAKRTCRIYLPYLVALVFAVGSYLIFFNPVQPEGLSTSFGWRILTPSEIVTLLRQNVVFVGWFRRDYWNGPTWTLAEEMRISFIYPLLALMVQRWRWRTSLLVALFCSALVSLVIHTIHHRSPLETLHYACIFVLGALMASHRQAIVDYWERQRGGVRAVLVVASVLVCSYTPMLMDRFPRAIPEELGDWLMAFTGAVFLAAAMARTTFRSFLRHRYMQHVGRTSYGIYLLHLPWLFVLITLFWTRLPHGVVFALTFVVTMISAEAFYRFVERPSIALGKHLALRIRDFRLRSHEVSNVPVTAPQGM